MVKNVEKSGFLSLVLSSLVQIMKIHAKRDKTYISLYLYLYGTLKIL
jgi:hypothetical protein